jgi:ribonuclease P protein subunit RPR2
MAKVKASKGVGSVPNKALHSRVSYLYQAAAYLATQQQHSRTDVHVGRKEEPPATTTNLQKISGFNPASRRLISGLRSVSMKAQMRMSPAMKHSVCKNCDTMLIDGSTCTNEVENKSKGGRKRWADVLVRKCNTCGFEKRFPIGAERQTRRPNRTSDDKLDRKRDLGTMKDG